MLKRISIFEDLLEFTSHEYLVYYFWGQQCKKRLYYFAGTDVVNCSVLFINTKRQVIFIWLDGLNQYKIGNLLFDGDPKLKSRQETDDFVAESSWVLKRGVHVGMSLLDLRALKPKEHCLLWRRCCQYRPGFS